MAVICLTDDQISRLRYINKKNLKPGKYDFPDFLIIGPQRTGTTWLYHNLVFHPQIFMPFQKELYFFNNLIEKKTNNKFISDRLEFYANNFSPMCKSNFIYFLKSQLKNLQTSKKIHVVGSNVIKYFTNSLVKGEATASYATMDKSLIREIITLNPEIKLIMLIRHPFDRAWSHAKKDLIREVNKSFKDISWTEFQEFYVSDFQIQCGHYTEIIRKWQKYVKQENFFVDLFDNIMKNPNNLLLKVFSFLNISADEKYISNNYSKTLINRTFEQKIPTRHREYLSKLFAGEVSKLNNMFNVNWLTD